MEEIYLEEKGLYQNILITGTIGTGKTSSAMYPFTKQLLEYQAYNPKEKLAMLVLDVKGNYYKEVIKFAELSHRTNDIITIDLTSKFKYNPLDKPELKPIVLANRLKTILTFESLIYENNLKINYDIKDNLKLKCDSDKMKQLITILLDNAIKHSYKKSTIRVNLYKEKDNIILEVINRGEEIPKSERNKIFERFYKADKSRNRNENRYGLGLAIAKNIVTMHNGKINVTCSGGYTTFTCTFKI